MNCDKSTLGAQPCCVKSKACNKCGVVKPLTEFHKHSTRKDGKQPCCKVCACETARRWHEANRESHLEYLRRWKEANRERHLEGSRRWRETNRAKVQKIDRRYRAEYPEKVRARKALQYAVRSGKLKRPPYCQHCYTPCKPQAHHYDHTNPLDVWWLCSLCHGKVHRIDA